MSEPPSKRAKVDVCTGDFIYFRITTAKQLNLQKLAPLSAAVAEKFSADDFAITLYSHTSTGHLEGDGTFYCEPLVELGPGFNPTVVLSDITQDVGRLQEHCEGRRVVGDLFWALGLAAAVEQGDSDALSQVLSNLVVAGAFPGKNAKLHETDLARVTILRELQHACCAVEQFACIDKAWGEYMYLP